MKQANVYLSFNFDKKFTYFRELEAKVSLAPTTVTSLPLGNSVYLSLDVPSESTNIYNALSKFYIFCNHFMKENANFVLAFQHKLIIGLIKRKIMPRKLDC